MSDTNLKSFENGEDTHDLGKVNADIRKADLAASKESHPVLVSAQKISLLPIKHKEMNSGSGRMNHTNEALSMASPKLENVNNTQHVLSTSFKDMKLKQVSDSQFSRQLLNHMNSSQDEQQEFDERMDSLVNSFSIILNYHS